MAIELPWDQLAGRTQKGQLRDEEINRNGQRQSHYNPASLSTSQMQVKENSV